MNINTKKSMIFFKIALAAAVLTMWAAPAPVQAYIYGFSDEYYVNSLSTYHSIFGSSTAGYGTAGIYQETNTSTPIVTKLSNGSSVPGEYMQNTTPNLNQELTLFGWSQSLNNGQQVANVYNVTNPANGSVLYFRYNVGGVATTFNLNSLDFRGSSPSASLNFTLQGLDSSNNVLDTTNLLIAGNTFSTVTLNWAGVYQVLITGSPAPNWGSGTLYMDNVNISTAVATPEPGMLALLAVGMLGVAGVSLKKRYQSPKMSS